MNISLLCFAALSLTIVAVAQTPHALGADLTKKAQNPILWADVPDIAMIRVGDTYYMSSTTMHMSPHVPIMKSKDLVNWAITAPLAGSGARRTKSGPLPGEGTRATPF